MKSGRKVLAVAFLLAAVAVGGCASAPPQPAPDFRALVAHPDRADGDRAVDLRRKPEMTNSFLNS